MSKVEDSTNPDGYQCPTQMAPRRNVFGTSKMESLTAFPE